jgi:hypothetical protein
MSHRGMLLSGTEDAQSRRDIRTYADTGVLEVAKEAGIDVLRHPCEDRGVHVGETGEEAWIHRHGRGFAVGHAVLSHDSAQVLGLVERNGACSHVASDVHAEELGEVTQVLEFECATEASFERR